MVSDAVCGASRSDSDRAGSSPPSSAKSGLQQLVERRVVAARDDTGRHRGHRRRPGHVHRQRDLAEELPGAQDAALSQRLLRNAGDAGEQHVEAVARITFAHEDRARGDILAPHPVCEISERLPGQRAEEPDPRELGHRCGNVLRRHASTVPTWLP